MSSQQWGHIINAQSPVVNQGVGLRVHQFPLAEWGEGTPAGREGRGLVTRRGGMLVLCQIRGRELSKLQIVSLLA